MPACSCCPGGHPAVPVPVWWVPLMEDPWPPRHVSSAPMHASAMRRPTRRLPRRLTSACWRSGLGPDPLYGSHATSQSRLFDAPLPRSTRSQSQGSRFSALASQPRRCRRLEFRTVTVPFPVTRNFSRHGYALLSDSQVASEVLSKKRSTSHHFTCVQPPCQ